MIYKDLSKKQIEMMFPPGTIVGFIKAPDRTWSLCNGKDGKPDLSGDLSPFKHRWYIRKYKEVHYNEKGN